MSVTGLQLLHQAGHHLGEITAACGRVDGYFGAVPVEDIEDWLERMTFYDDFADPGWHGTATPRGREYGFQLWTATRIWFVSEHDGSARLDWLPLVAYSLGMDK